MPTLFPNSSCTDCSEMSIEKNHREPSEERNAATDTIPSRFQRLGKIDYLEDGSTGQVFKICGDQEYALKIIQCGTNETKYQRAVYELHIMSELRGEPSIVRLCDYEETDSKGSYTLYLLEDFHRSLPQYLASKSLTATDLIQLVMGVCDSLLTCKRHGVLHLDVKPSNVYVDDQSSVKIGDFSHSLRLEDAQSNHMLRGTMSFMAPEVYRDGKCEERSDLYSVGLILYYLFNKKQMPFMETDSQETAIYKRLAGTPLPKIVLDNSDLQKDINQIISKACAFAPSDRYTGIEELKEELNKVFRRIVDCSEKNSLIYSKNDLEQKRELPLIYVLQESSSIQETNMLVHDTLEIIKRETAQDNAEIRVSALIFGDSVKWACMNATASAVDIVFSDSAKSNLGLALLELDEKLSVKGENNILSRDCYTPIVIFATNGISTDDVEAARSVLESNQWYRRALKICYALGDDYDLKTLMKLTGSTETVLEPTHSDRIRYYIKNITVGPTLEKTVGADRSNTKSVVPEKQSDSLWNCNDWDATLDDWDDIPMSMKNSKVLHPPMSLSGSSDIPHGTVFSGGGFGEHFFTNEMSISKKVEIGESFEGIEDYNPSSIETPFGKAARHCRTCGNPIENSVIFCPWCGSKVLNESQEIEVRKVEFSALSPKRLVKGNYSLINIVMYEKSSRYIVDSLKKEIEEAVQETRSGIQKVKEGVVIKIVLSSPDITIEDNTEERIWKGDYLIFSFSVFLPDQYDKKQLMLTASVYINDMIATKLKFIIKCFSLLEQKIIVSREDVMSAFVSYASQDRNRVAAIIQGMKKARPDMDVFFDVENLRSGEDWEKALHREIESRDVLFLCWSHFACESEWVDTEWRYAFEKKGADCIEPIPIESPDVCPPPEELKHKHFNDKLLYIINTQDEKKEW